jgi:8-oxo-dGTP diphosphatase
MIPDKKVTLCIIKNNGKILLSYKESGFGAGFWNFPGGKIDDGEEPQQTIIREVEEESGLIIENPIERCLLKFWFAKEQKMVQCYVFEATTFGGQLQDTNEMKRHEWFDMNLTSIPFDQMWPGDRYWLDYYLKHPENFQAFIEYENEESKRFVRGSVQGFRETDLQREIELG